MVSERRPRWTRRAFLTSWIVICLKFCVSVAAHTSSSYPQFQEQQPSRIILVQMLFRHGDRSPISVYPTDPNGAAVWQQGLGQLTQVGIKQAYNYGKELRQRYIGTGILPHNYNRSEVYVRSTDFDRTIMTAQSLLTGLYPSNFSDWELGTWQPIPVHMESGNSDQLFGHAMCPQLEKVKREWQSRSEKFLNFHARNKMLYDVLSSHTGMNVAGENVGGIADTVFCETQHNMTQPAWLTQNIHTKLMEVRNQATELAFAASGTARLFAGPLLADIISNMEQKAKNGSTYKLLLFSAHDSTVIGLSSAMGVFNNLHPPYLCSIIIELFQQGGNFFVRTLFHNHSAEAPYNMTVQGCPVMCPLEQFSDLLQDQILPSKDRAVACAESKSVSDILKQNAIPALVGAVMVLIALIVCVTYKLVKLKKQQRQTNLRYRQLLQENGEVETDDEEDLESAS